VAAMLNDNIETVMQNYSHLETANVAEDVYRQLDARLGVL
jgi:hypothetical protein